VVQFRLVAHLTPGEAIEACETALRQLLQLVVPPLVGEDWLAQQLTPEKLAQLEERRKEEGKKRVLRGVASTPQSLLAYADLFTLRTLTEKNWQHLAPALGKKSETGALLKRLDDLRNAIAHNRPLVPFERDLAAGIAGEIRNRVTIFMSTNDPAGDIYPRIEFAQDNFGNSIDPIGLESAGMGGNSRTGQVVYERDVLTFTLRGSDPQNRDLEWQIHSNRTEPAVITSDGGTATLRLELSAIHVTEELVVGVFMKATGTPYHRSGTNDHRVFWYYKCRPRESNPDHRPATSSL
jgi:hypothetical protein